MKYVIMYNWSIITNMSGRGDYLALNGQVDNHPDYTSGTFITPSSFVKFDRMKYIGVSASGKKYQLDPASFNPNGNAKNIEIALDWIEKCAKEGKR